MLNSTQDTRRRVRQRRTDSPEPDLIIGAENIAKETGQKVSAVYYWHSKRMYGDAVWKAGFKTLAASRERLRNLGKADS